MTIDGLLAFLGDNGFPLAALIVCVVWLAWRAAWHLSAFIERWKGKEDDIRKLKESWDKGYHYLRERLDFLVERVNKQGERLDSLVERVGEQNRRLDEQSECLDAFDQSVNPNTPVKSAGPLSLTEVGRNIAEAIGADSIIDQHSVFLHEAVKRHEPDNPYDLQKACFSVAENELEPLLTDKQLKAFKNQAVGYGIRLFDVYKVIAVLLRDRMLREYGWNISNIDQRAPTSDRTSERCPSSRRSMMPRRRWT